MLAKAPAKLTICLLVALSAAALAQDDAQAYEVWSSYYSYEFAGSPMANGVPFDPEAHTCAHRTLEFGTYLGLESDGYYSWCYVTDRGPYIAGRDLDVSLQVAEELTLTYEGVDLVDIYNVEGEANY